MARSLAGSAAILSLLASLFATQVNAHGYVQSITANGKTIKGPKPTDEGGATDSSAIRLSSSEQPVILNAAGGLNDPILACKNPTNSPAGSLATITAGTDLSIQWVNGAGDVKWPHNTGPILTYLAPCADSTCNDDATKLNFVKIAEDGQVPGSTSAWVQADLYAGKPYNVTIPANVANGNYIMRHEVINLAPGPGNDESYPACFQLTVTGGSGSGTPAAFVGTLTGSTTNFPGGYASTDPGLMFDAYAGKSYSDSFPGPVIPDVFAAGSGGGGGSPPASTSSVPKSSTLPTSTGTVAQTTAPVVSKPASSSPSVPTTSPGGSPRVYVTTVTEIFVMTMTLDDNQPNNNKLVTSTRAPATTTISSAQPTTTSSVSDPEDPEDECLDEEEEETTTHSVAPSTRTSSVVPTSSGINKRHISARARRSERWRAAAPAGRS